MIKNILKQAFSPFSACFTADSGDSSNIPQRGQSSHDSMPLSSNMSTPSLTPSSPISPASAGADLDLFLVNKPDTYNKLLGHFISTHGPDSDKVRRLIVPEETLADRAYNLHVVTDSGPGPVLYNTLRRKSSLSRLLDSPGESPVSDASMSGVDRILADHSVGVEVAIDILKNLNPPLWGILLCLV